MSTARRACSVGFFIFLLLFFSFNYKHIRYSRRAALQKSSARRLSAKSPKGARSQRFMKAEELTAGGVDTQMNPMMIRDGSVNVGTKKDGQVMTPELEALVEGLLSQTERPPQEVWRVFQATFSQLHAAAAEGSRLVIEGKERAHRVSLGLSASKDVPSKDAPAATSSLALAAGTPGLDDALALGSNPLRRSPDVEDEPEKPAAAPSPSRLAVGMGLDDALAHGANPLHET
jgi:hypothetical protein